MRFNNLFLIFGLSERISKFFYTGLAIIFILFLIKILITNESSRQWIFGLIVFATFCSALVCGFKTYQYFSARGGNVGDFIHSLISSSSAEKISDYTFKFNKVSFSATGKENEYKVTIEDTYKRVDELGNEIPGSFDLDLSKNWNIYVDDMVTNNTNKSSNYINAEYIYTFYNEDFNALLTDTLKIKFVFYNNYYRVDLITNGGETAVDFWESYIYKEGLTVGLKINEYEQDSEINLITIPFVFSERLKSNVDNIQWKISNSKVFLNVYYCDSYDGDYLTHVNDKNHSHNFISVDRVELNLNYPSYSHIHYITLPVKGNNAVYYFDIDNQNPYVINNMSKIYMHDLSSSVSDDLFGNNKELQKINELEFDKFCYYNVLDKYSLLCEFNFTFDYLKYSEDSNPSVKFEVEKVAGLYETGTTTLTKSWEQLLADGDITFRNGLLYVSSKNLAGDLICDNVDGLTSLHHAVSSCDKLTSIDLSRLNTDNLTDMSGMFFGCQKLRTIKFGKNFNTFYVKDMSDVFAGCSSLTELDLSSFDTRGATTMSGMFYMCSSLKHLDLSKFNTSSVEGMYQMFLDCENLVDLDLSSFNTKNVTSMGSMFYNCNSLTTLDLSNFNTTKVTSMWNMFSGCSKLTTLNLSSFDTSNVEIFSRMFSDCSLLESINIGYFVTTSADKEYQFDTLLYDCRNLSTIYYKGTSKQWQNLGLKNPFYPTNKTMQVHCSDTVLTINLK